MRTCFSGKEYRENWPCVSRKIQPHDVVGAIFGPRLMAGGTKGPDDKMVGRELILPEGLKNKGSPKDVNMNTIRFING
jgi:hypothetical protein